MKGNVGKGTRYNIHNLLKVAVMRKGRVGLVDFSDLKLSYFQTRSDDEPDVVVYLGPFEPRLRGTSVIDGKYYVGDDYIYCSEREGQTRWRVAISGWQSGPMALELETAPVPWAPLARVYDLYWLLLTRIIEYRLLSKGYVLLHAAGLEREGGATVLAGRGGSYKTTLAMRAVRDRGWRFMGDDRVILGPEAVYAFPTSLPVFQYMTRHLAHEDAWTPFDKLRFLLELRSQRLSKVVQFEICDRSPLRSLCLLSNGSHLREETLQVMGLDDTVALLLANNRLEDYVAAAGVGVRSAPFLRYMYAYSTVHPDSGPARYWERSARCLRGLLEDAQAIKVSTSPLSERGLSLLENLLVMSGAP